MSERRGHAVQVGELVSAAIVKCFAMEAMHTALFPLDSDERKRLVTLAYERGVLDAEQVRMLIEAYGLETA